MSYTGHLMQPHTLSTSPTMAGQRPHTVGLWQIIKKVDLPPYIHRLKRWFYGGDG